MPSLAAERVSSPSDAFFPPTRGMSAKESSSNQHTLAESDRGDGLLPSACVGGREGREGTDARMEAGARVLAFMGKNGNGLSSVKSQA